MKITKRQLRRIIKEELTLAPGHGGEFGIFDPDYIYNMLAEEVDSYLTQIEEATLTAEMLHDMRSALTAAADRIEAEFGEGLGL
jgi:hypothetical protein